jgi:P-type E1-E2 ATPase
LTVSDTELVPETPVGLTEDEARRRLAARGRRRKPSAGRSYASIVRGNLFNLPNAVLTVLGVATIVLGELADALFLGIVVANVVIGSVQEIRAKKALERLAALVKPEARVVRDGRERTVSAEEAVEGDLVALQPGDQVVADGRMVAADALRLDESILTGESKPVRKKAGNDVLSGAFAVEGTGLYTVTAVGSESYAEQVAGEARAFRHPSSPFQRGLGRLVVGLVLLGIPLGIALSISLWIRDVPFEAALPTVVAAGINLVPEGLILLSSIVYVTGALKMSRRGALVQQLNAVESLASADVVCTDKTGTLTEPRLRVVSLLPAAGESEAELAAAFGRYVARSQVRNSTLEALADAFPGEHERAAAAVPFSSRWKWSAVRLGAESLVLGAPELFPLGDLEPRAREEADGGRRVIALASTHDRLDAVEPTDGPPADMSLLGLATLSEELRPNTRETVRFFHAEEIELKVISGDAPPTVATIAADAGIPSHGHPVDGRELPESEPELQALMRDTAVVGRISPEGKRRIVEALRDDGRFVAMIGDGVNDVPALKSSRVAIAQGSGAQMARTVSDLVLVQGDFGAVPHMVAEGRQILRNMQRVSKLYVTKCLFGAFIVLAVGLWPVPYPFLPRHLSLASFFVTGVPPFFLALAPSSGPWRMSNYVRDVGRFAVPAACAIGTGVVVSYLLAYLVLDLPLVDARTVSVTVFVAASLWVVFSLEATSRRRARWVGAMCAILLALYAAALLTPVIRDIFRVVVPGGEILAMSAVGVAIAVAVLAAVGIRPRFDAST